MMTKKFNLAIEELLPQLWTILESRMTDREYSRFKPTSLRRDLLNARIVHTLAQSFLTPGCLRRLQLKLHKELADIAQENNP